MPNRMLLYDYNYRGHKPIHVRRYSCGISGTNGIYNKRFSITPEVTHPPQKLNDKIMENNDEQQGQDSGCNTAPCYAKDDPLHAIQRAIAYCEAYNIKKGSKMYEAVIAAYTTGYHNGLNKI